MADLAELEARLKAATQRCERAQDPDNFLPAYRARLNAERALALAKNEETAVEVLWTPLWDPGAPEPHLLCSGWKTLLLYYIAEHDPNWDGSYVQVADPASPVIRAIALVEFQMCTDATLGGPNDEGRHPLVDRGYGGYGAYLVKNSRWIEQNKRMASFHPSFDPSTWTDPNHYLLAFHDQTLECLAEGYRIEELRVSFSEAFEVARLRLMGDDSDE